MLISSLTPHFILTNHKPVAYYVTLRRTGSQNVKTTEGSLVKVPSRKLFVSCLLFNNVLSIYKIELQSNSIPTRVLINNCVYVANSAMVCANC